MKKKIVISLLVVVLVLAGLAGGVYAGGPHEAEWGNKLVGMGWMGTWTPVPYGKDYIHSVFSFANPDPVNSIEITKVSIIRADGTVVYEGPYIQVGVPPGETELVREIVTRPMEPHEIWGIASFFYMYKGGELTDPDSWLDSGEAFEQPFEQFTVEIFWRPTTKSPTCPLIGWQDNVVGHCDPSSGIPDYLLGDARTACPMINVTQGK